MKKLLILLITVITLSGCTVYNEVLETPSPVPTAELDYNDQFSVPYWRPLIRFGNAYSFYGYWDPYFSPYWSSFGFTTWYYSPYMNWYRPFYWNRPYHAQTHGHRGRLTSIYTNTRGLSNLIRNDQTTRFNTRTARTQTQSRSNGRRSRSRQILPNEQVRTYQPDLIQSRQVRRRPQSPVLQQPRSIQRTSRQGRGSSRGNG